MGDSRSRFIAPMGTTPDPSQALSVLVTWPQERCKAGHDCPTYHVPKNARVLGRGVEKKGAPSYAWGWVCLPADPADPSCARHGQQDAEGGC